LPGIDHDQLRCGQLVRESERVQQLQLVEQVVLEPEHDLHALAQSVDEPAVPPLERRENRAAAAPAALREERRAQAQQLRPRDGRHRPFVENVLRRQHRAAQCRLPQGVACALAVRDVQYCRHLDIPTAPSKVRRAARAMVERVACATDDACELVAHPLQAGDA
jgi:hypothetical protein